MYDIPVVEQYKQT